MSTNRTIHLKGTRVQEEAIASGIFSPGHLIKLDSSSKVLKHATEGGYAELLFGIEHSLDGKTIDDAYAVNDLSFYVVGKGSNTVFAYLKAGYNYAVGTQLISAGDGTLKPVANAATGVTVKQIIGVVTDALNLSATGAVSARTAVRLL